MVSAKRKENITIELQAREHTVLADEGAKVGGTDLGPTPHEILEMALAACTSMTVQMYANHKQWPLESCDVKVQIVAESTEGTQIQRTVSFRGNLDSEQKTRLLDIANKCPIHKLLSHPIQIQTEMAGN
jgi:putative redox protein